MAVAAWIAGCNPCMMPDLAALPTHAPPATEPAFFALERVPVPTELQRSYNHTATIAALPDGSLVVAWGAGSHELARDTAIVLSRRTPDGAWSDAAVVADTPGQPDANCVLFLDDAGVLHLYYVSVFGLSFCEGRVMEQRSGDGGFNWSAPWQALPAVCTMIKNKPLILSSGRWLLPAYVQAVYASQFWLSDDHGKTWRPTLPLLTLPNNLQPAVIERSDGSVLALMRRAGFGGFTWQGLSHDAGETWCLSLLGDLRNPNSGLDLLRHSSGVFVVAYNDSETRRTPLVVRASLDEGRTWLPSRTIAEGEGPFAYPSLIESADGRMHVVYSDRLEAVEHAEFNLAYLTNGS